MIGIGWALVQPVFTMFVLGIFHTVLGAKDDDRIPYSVRVVSGLVPWTFLIHAITTASSSLLSFYGVLQKVYFPRLVLPLSTVLAASVDFGVALPLIPVAMIYFGVRPTATLVWLPVFMILTVLLAAALGIWLAMLNTLFRDTANALPFLTQLWFFLTPIAFPASMIPERFAILAGLNPMLGILEGFRFALFGTASPHLTIWLGFSFGIIVVLMITGTLFFLRNESSLTENL